LSGRNLLYLASGGPTPVLNASASAVLQRAREARAASPGAGQRLPRRILAARDGLIGLRSGELLDTDVLRDAEVLQIAHTPGAVFGTCRDMLADAPRARARELAGILQVLRQHDIGSLILSGGNGSMDTALQLHLAAREAGWPLAVVGVPKTIDNDIVLTDCSPGFGSAAKYVAASTLEIAHEVAAIASSSTRIYVLEVMGRHAGWLAAASALARRDPGDAPHVILMPEAPVAPSALLQRVARQVASKGWAVVVVAEGARSADGRLWAEMRAEMRAELRPEFAGRHRGKHQRLGGAAPVLADWLGRRLKYKVRWSVLDYLQRASRHLASQADFELAIQAGRLAVDAALAGHGGVMVGVRRVATRQRQSQGQPQWQPWLLPLARVANFEKRLPKRYVLADGMGVSAGCLRYLRPLIQGEAYPPYRDGVPDYLPSGRQFPLV
jgi:6-phosphofructokinase